MGMCTWPVSNTHCFALTKLHLVDCRKRAGGRVCALQLRYHHYALSLSLSLSPLPVPSSSPAGLTGYPTGSRSLSLSWRPPAVPNGVVVRYHINVTALPTSTSWQLTSPSLAREVTGLHPYYTYSIRVAAVTVGEGPFSPAVNIRTFQDGTIILTVSGCGLYLR